MNLKKNDIRRASITGYTSEGAGVCRVEGVPVFVPRAAIGDDLFVRVLKTKKTYAFGRIEELILPSPDRTREDCPIFSKCGGCAFRHITYEAELASKKARVEDAFSRIAGISADIPDVLPSPDIDGYRNKAIYQLGRNEAGVFAGFYRRHTHDVIPAPNCRLHPDLASRIAASFCAYASRRGLSVFDEAAGRGLLRHLFIRTSHDGRAQVGLVTSGEPFLEPEAFIARLLDDCPEIESILQIENREPGNVVLRGEVTPLYGPEKLRDELLGLSFDLSPFSFYQVNRRQAEALYRLAAEFASLSGAETVFDLYCGTGTISLCLAAQGAGRVYGVEHSPGAVRDAYENALENNIENAEFLEDDAAAAASRLTARGIRPDVVIVDPPRKGLSPEAVDVVLAASPARIVYVSCAPATLARDTRLFVDAGYELSRVQPVDMFPRTANIETVVLLSKQKVNHLY
ncbi:23S rRNA (uracil(1939)-C(5))-methyltransferase RlmD [Oscillospiraceae bacterium OttesenSCG-928-G22]|nr:23S rRNA (uracil(1939)-C(5))-methyltransferase RlmD [Oscillospiraceae bacterium OttesenSCG-928-G22]